MIVLNAPFPPAPCNVEDIKRAWRAAADDLRLAHADWCQGTPAVGRERYAVVIAAADREAAAADALARAVAINSAAA